MLQVVKSENIIHLQKELNLLNQLIQKHYMVCPCTIKHKKEINLVGFPLDFFLEIVELKDFDIILGEVSLGK